MLMAITLFAMQLAPNTPTADDGQHTLKVDMQLDAAFFADADKSGDGRVSLDEFIAGMDKRIDAAISANPAAQKKITLDHRSAMREKMLAPSFRSFDKNSDGFLTLAEATPSTTAEVGASK